MGQTRGEIDHNLAERLCWQVARRDDTRVARGLYCKQLVDGVYRLDEGALLDDLFSFLKAFGVMVVVEQVHGAAIQRGMIPFVQYVLLYKLKTLWGAGARMYQYPAAAAVVCRASEQALARLS